MAILCHILKEKYPIVKKEEHKEERMEQAKEVSAVSDHKHRLFTSSAEQKEEYTQEKRRMCRLI